MSEAKKFRIIIDTLIMSDKTTPHIGKLLTDEAQRDAVHIAVAPVVAGERLHPGQHVGISVTEEALSISPRNGSNTIGIVDPFLEVPVPKGERFFLFLYPCTITSLRHEWTHPAFASANSTPDSVKAEARLRAIANDLGVSYEEVILAGQSHDFPGSFGNEIHGDREIRPLFWEDIERVTGKSAPPDKRPTHFRCAC